MDRLACGFEVKFAPDSDDGTFSGYASVFGNLDTHRDVVEKGAFTDTIGESKASGNWPAMLLMHGMGTATEDQMPIGIWTAMAEDSTGLHVEGKLALKTSRGADCYELMKMTPRPALNGLSIGYRARKFTNNPGGQYKGARRLLQSVALAEVSLVTDPSNALATVTGVKFAERESKTLKEFEAFLRDEGGFSHAAAKKIASGDIKAGLNLRDEDGSGDDEVKARLEKLRNLFLSH